MTTPLQDGVLDRGSFVPLYYQLQEHLKEMIEAGRWRPGERIPSEPELCRAYGVSRTVVRQALAILEDDRQVVRERGRGTFVAPPKLEQRVGGLSRLLDAPRPDTTRIRVLDVREVRGERSVASALHLAPGSRLARFATLLEIGGRPLAITYSFFRAEGVRRLRELVEPGADLDRSIVLRDFGIELEHSTVAIEASLCGKFEAEVFGVPHRSPVFLARCVEHRRRGRAVVPFEVARVEYRGDIVQFALELRGETRSEPYATWELRGAAT